MSEELEECESTFFDSFIFRANYDEIGENVKRPNDDSGELSVDEQLASLLADLNSNPIDMRDNVRCRYCGFLADKHITCRGLRSFRVLQDHSYFSKLLFSSRECQKSFISMMSGVRREVKSFDYMTIDQMARRRVLFAPSYHVLKFWPFGGTIETHEEFLKPVRTDPSLSTVDLEVIEYEEQQYNSYYDSLISSLSEVKLDDDKVVEEEEEDDENENVRKKIKMLEDEIEEEKIYKTS